ncbi:multidrug efflux pump subunit AcrA (membrane-fusion protein) [Kitasatospora sp. MAP12-15]|uniref:HlyD family efflux transporter periplasmic adaptor subunit n=1 Tax=unclassified Kitasatospora TaxID=2633591 RepID=UPI002473D75D|nr:HlyD family efflux transporter periplasmic adaptor subunit [Kitasatospora sp. MAP12-44]MDH6108449.1 multidrug efflux pump subunit AcrA (membrane-fusion protein) [Kitasatospora sp. MAP12-44]
MAKPSRPVRGMNAALASGEAGVGEIRPARAPMGVKQLAVAVSVALVGSGIGVLTYNAIASRPVSFSGEVAPAHAYYLNFPNTATVQTLTVRPGDHVKAGQVLATQVSSVAAANLAAAQAAVDADNALLTQDRNPQTTADQIAQNQLDVAKAQAATTTAQGALTLAQNEAQNATAAQSTVVTSDQATLDNDTTHYALYCSATPAGPTPPAPPAPPPAALTPIPAPSASAPSPSASASHSTTPAPPTAAPSTPVGQEEFCTNLQSQLDKDSAALAQAQASLGAIQSSNQAQEQQDAGRLSQSQVVLQTAQAKVGAQGTALTPATIAQAQSQLATAQAQLASDQLALRQTSIVAPADGVVADTAGAAGDVVGPEGVRTYAGPAAQSGTLVNQQPGIQLFVPSAAPGTASSTSENGAYSAVVTVYAGPLSVTAQLPESEITAVHQGQAATLNVSATGHTVTGRISQILLDPARVPGGTYYDVTITTDSQQSDLLAGMSVDVSLG